jgi:hypothetical protein
MATGLRKKRLFGKTILYGAISAVLYAAVFANAETVLGLFTRGGLYAALPIGTVVVFSLAHGAFAHNLWSVLGIEAATKETAQRPTAPAPRPVKRPRARLRLSV